MDARPQTPHPIFEFVGQRLYDEVEEQDGEEIAVARYCLLSEVHDAAVTRLDAIEDPAELDWAVLSVIALARFVRREGHADSADDIEALVARFTAPYRAHRVRIETNDRAAGARHAKRVLGGEERRDDVSVEGPAFSALALRCR